MKARLIDSAFSQQNDTDKILFIWQWIYNNAILYTKNYFDFFFSGGSDNIVLILQL